jgi:putative protease
MARKIEKPLLLSPFDNLEETLPLIEAGADELYGGVLPDDWGSGRLSPNQRTFASAQFSSEKEFAKAVELAGSRDVPVYLTMNAPLNPPEAQKKLLGLAKRCAGYGVKGVIAGDPGLIVKIRETGIPLEITLSTMAGALNASAFALFAGLGVSRAVLPRHLTLGETAEITAALPDLTFEAFVLVGKCPNEEAHCFFQHTAPDKRWPCEIAQTVNAAGDNPLKRRFERWSSCDRRFSCGLCAIRGLIERGVSVQKLVGRGGPTAGKVANVRMVRRFMDNPALGRAEALLAYCSRFGMECDPLVCYYPELHPYFGG